ncbi:PLP-dependent aminotransferase family protein [Methylophaga sp.]|uniref:aminotransferase-like domain-containing protein n=1 Tax=Methylophaga sp. TaxID=2024840 RepID=UPI00271B80D6|nr:PLP-dependent aminotransferase family protein [Methylophaga sp.]MDO8826233.1 PLP-dependent aminotransferase family protein [Methylophaga sp.]
MLLYQKMAAEIRSAINDGVYQPGDKLPGIRSYAKQRHISVSTAIAAYHSLEDQGVIESISKSGFYVRPQLNNVIELPKMSARLSQPKAVGSQQMTLQLVNNASNPGIIGLGAAVPDKSFLPVKLMGRYLTQVHKQHLNTVITYDKPAGLMPLRQQIAKRMVAQGCHLVAEDIVITNGCQEAVYLALRSCTQPGDVVAVESPTYYGLLQIMESLSLKALEIPTDPVTGISIEALELALDQWPVKACVVVASFGNPLGACIPDEKKQQLAQLAKDKKLMLIEDDVYGELCHQQSRPTLLKSYDLDDNIIYCSSFSKTLSPGLRVGWVASHSKARQLEYLKYVLNFSSANPGQLAIAQILESGQYDRYLRQVRQQYANATQRLVNKLFQLFPVGTRITQPSGGFVVWLELPGKIDTVVLANNLLDHNISIAPGSMFTNGQKFGNCIRLSAACKWNENVELALVKIAEMIGRMSADKSSDPQPSIL